MNLLSTFRHLFHPQRSNNHRPRVLHPEAFFIFAILAAGFWLSVSATPTFLQRAGNVLGFSSSITADQVVQKTNVERKKLGLAPLTTNDKLNQAAMAKAANMFANQYWAHIAPDGTTPWKFFKDAGYAYNVAGENLARDFSNSDDLMAAWMNSPTHRENILNARYKEIGVAVVSGKLLGSDTVLVVQLFGSPLSGAPQISQRGEETVQNRAQQESQDQQQSPNAGLLPGLPAAPAILGSGVFPLSSLPLPNSSVSPLFSPLQLSKAFFLAMIFLIVMTLIYDSVIMNNRNTVRLVGKNFAHIALFMLVAFLLILFKGGIVQ